MRIKLKKQKIVLVKIAPTATISTKAVSIGILYLVFTALNSASIRIQQSNYYLKSILDF